MSISKASSVGCIWEMWLSLKLDGVSDRYSVRVFEGHLYSLIEDDDFYETSGFRKLVNILLFHWDPIRAFALKDEAEQGFGVRTITRTDDEQLHMNNLSNALHKWMLEFVSSRD